MSLKLVHVKEKMILGVYVKSKKSRGQAAEDSLTVHAEQLRLVTSFCIQSNRGWHVSSVTFPSLHALSRGGACPGTGWLGQEDGSQVVAWSVWVLGRPEP